MSGVKMAVACGFALGLLSGAAFAQDGPNQYSGHVDANGMPTDHSTPAERAQTRALNNGISSSNQAADAQADAERQQYQQQRSQYDQRQMRYQGAMQRHARQQDAYQARRDAYALQRAQYNAQMARHRHRWPRHADWVMVGAARHPVGLRVQLMDGAPAGTVGDVVRGPEGRVQALLVRLNGGKQVWIDSADVRFDPADRVLMTNLGHRDLRDMAGERL